MTNDPEISTPLSRDGVRNAFCSPERRERASEATSASLGTTDGRHAGPHDWPRWRMHSRKFLILCTPCFFFRKCTLRGLRNQNWCNLIAEVDVVTDARAAFACRCNCYGNTHNFAFLNPLRPLGHNTSPQTQKCEMQLVKCM